MIRQYISSGKDRLIKIFELNTPKYFDTNEILGYKNYLKEKADTYLTIDNEIVGGAGYFVNENDHSGRITWIFFDPNHSGIGLGREIVEYCINLLNKDIRVRKFTITTSQLA